ncbi:MAG: hypothetical protein PF450_10530 [Bacteroidales bacterium]|jgi:hypothetical protein|nr:hypothetical protein [Bacteroidales bacterium]
MKLITEITCPQCGKIDWDARKGYDIYDCKFCGREVMGDEMHILAEAIKIKGLMQIYLTDITDIAILKKEGVIWNTNSYPNSSMSIRYERGDLPNIMFVSHDKEKNKMVEVSAYCPNFNKLFKRVH